MKLPSLSVIIISQAILWCVAGAYIHGWKLLLYPLCWAIVAGGFYYHSKRNPIFSTPELSPGPFANSKVQEDTVSEKAQAAG